MQVCVCKLYVTENTVHLYQKDKSLNVVCGPGSSVGIGTDYGLEGPGSNPGGDEIFHPSRPALRSVQTGPEVHPASCKMGTGSFPGVKCGRGVLLTTHPPSSAAVMEE